MPAYKETLNIVLQECGKKTFQLTRKLFVIHGNLAKQRCHLFFNHRCKDEHILPKSLRICPPVRNHQGYEISKRFGFSFLSLRIKENHVMIKKLNAKINEISKEIIPLCSPRLWRHISRDLKDHYGCVFKTTKDNHKAKLDKLRKDNAGKSRVDENEKKKWVINLSSKKLSDDETSVLAKGMNFAVAPKRIPVDQFIAETESSISSLSPDKKSAIRNKVCSILSCAKPPKKNISQAEMKALKTLGKDKNIIILKADKGNSTVVMNRTEYDEKIEVMLSDSKTYQVLQSDPAKKCENKLKALISGYKDKIPDSIKRRISTTDGNTSRFYGLPKIHKQGIPLRPIVSFIGSPTYELSKYLCRILTPLVGNTTHHLRNTS